VPKPPSSRRAFIPSEAPPPVSLMVKTLEGPRVKRRAGRAGEQLLAAGENERSLEVPVRAARRSDRPDMPVRQRRHVVELAVADVEGVRTADDPPTTTGPVKRQGPSAGGATGALVVKRPRSADRPNVVAVHGVDRLEVGVEMIEARPRVIRTRNDPPCPSVPALDQGRGGGMD